LCDGAVVLGALDGEEVGMLLGLLEVGRTVGTTLGCDEGWLDGCCDG
jgi:uncharacterized membrane protein